jgi:hypothetical protein
LVLVISTSRLFVTALAGLLPVLALAAGPDFSGQWTIDMRTPAERQNKVECGIASFTLSQTGESINGEHSFSTPGCGRLNEGGAGSVKGLIVGATAVLVVTSGRNGAMVLGKATLSRGKLHWVTVQEIRLGEPEGESPLILGAGVLSRSAR